MWEAPEPLKLTATPAEVAWRLWLIQAMTQGTSVAPKPAQPVALSNAA